MKLKLLLGTLMFTAFTASAQLPSINENFNSFTTGTGSLPQNGWSTVIPPASNPATPTFVPMLTVEAGTGNNFVQAYSFFAGNKAFYLVTPQIVAPNGTQTLSFSSALIGGTPGGTGTLEVGLVASPTDMSTFTTIGTIVNLTSSTDTTSNFTVQSSSHQYIAFKFTATVNHVALRMDDVVLTAAGALGVSDQVKSKNNFVFAVNADNTALEFVAKTEPKNIEVYSAAGQKAAEGKLKGQKFDISSLHSGVYYMLIETAEGSVVKSKFIKK
ncbi:T9SS type A sorting domain-containing protein [Chryseobacterium kwangjuense]|nr:T9SS type A sorting domain-containing protein [Chryseobacterium kwangjuense]